ncbi:MAG: prepilin peptidase [Betaproteobacteria bacterium]|jgi:prepilin peptidase CpaA|nr:prepilin peptidase [Betaproteobacteria bacterium]
MAFEMLLELSPFHLAPAATLSLLALLLLAAGFDIAQRRVPNTLIIVGATTALALATRSGWPGISGAVIGGLAALVVLLPVYVSGIMGAGDVKLISMVGGFLGPHHFLFALLCIFVAGGALSMFYLLRQRLKGSSSGMPYAVAVLGGVSAYLSALS